MTGKFEIKKTNSGQYMFNLKARNGQIILTSEHYQQKASAENGIEAVRKSAADDFRFERKSAKSGQPFFVLKAANGQIVGRSEMYASGVAMENGIQSVMLNAIGARVVDVSNA